MPCRVVPPCAVFRPMRLNVAPAAASAVCVVFGARERRYGDEADTSPDRVRFAPIHREKVTIATPANQSSPSRCGKGCAMCERSATKGYVRDAIGMLMLAQLHALRPTRSSCGTGIIGHHEELATNTATTTTTHNNCNNNNNNVITDDVTAAVAETTPSLPTTAITPTSRQLKTRTPDVFRKTPSSHPCLPPSLPLSVRNER